MADDKLRIFFGGHACFDMVISGVRQMPAWGQLEQGTSSGWRVGGPGFAAAIALKRHLGDHIDARFDGVIGKGPFGDYLIKVATEDGLDVGNVTRNGTDSMTAVIVEAAVARRRAFIHVADANNLLTVADYPTDIVTPYQVCHIGGVGLLPGIHGREDGEINELASLMERLAGKGVVTSMDTVCIGAHVAGSLSWIIKKALRHTKIVFMSMKEAPAFTGYSKPSDVATFLSDAGAKVVYVKMSDKGVWLKVLDNQPVHIPAYSVTPKDTTGAGDGFCGFSLAYLLKNPGALNDEARMLAAGYHGAAGSALLVKNGEGVHGTPSYADTRALVEQ